MQLSPMRYSELAAGLPAAALPLARLVSRGGSPCLAAAAGRPLCRRRWFGQDPAFI
jgi:hypothetical protein